MLMFATLTMFFALKNPDPLKGIIFKYLSFSRLRYAKNN